MKGNRGAITVVLILVAILTTITFAQNIPIDMTNGVSTTYRFTSDLNLNTNIRLTVPPDQVISGNPGDLSSGAVICSGATGTMVSSSTPDDTRWASRAPTIVGPYPVCISGSCPPPMVDGTPASNIEVSWLPASLYDPFNARAGSALRERGVAAINAYGQLGDFPLQAISYQNISPGPIYLNKAGRAEIFCKGNLATYQNGVLVGTPVDLSDARTTTQTYRFTSPGTYTIESRIIGASCFGATVNYVTIPTRTSPGDLVNNFYMTYYNGRAPDLSSGVGASITRTITVRNPDPSTIPACSITPAGSAALVNNQGPVSIVRVVIRNTNDPATARRIHLSGVSSTNPAYTMTPLDRTRCEALRSAEAIRLGAATFSCPSSNGFGVNIPPNAGIEAYILVEQTGTGTGSIGAIFAADGDGQCGVSSHCSTTPPVDLTGIIPSPTGASGGISCRVVPGSMSIGTNEIAEFAVTCTNLSTGTTIGCPTDIWRVNGVSGEVLDSSSTRAHVVIRSGAGAIGNVEYAINSTVSCYAAISTIGPRLTCGFTPSSADLNVSQNQNFILSCLDRGTPVVPSVVNYRRTDGLAGTTSDETVGGVKYNAPAVPTSGNLRGDAQILARYPGITGAEATAPITVRLGGGSTLVANSCQIVPSPVDIPSGYASQFLVTCRNAAGAEVPCVGADWRTYGISGTYIIATPTMSMLGVTSSSGSVGSVEYRYDGRSDVLCNSTVRVTEPDIRCTFTPSSAPIRVGDTQRFDFSCAYVRGPRAGTPATVRAADYTLDPALDARLSASFPTYAKVTGLGTSSGLLTGVADIAGATSGALVGPFAQAFINILGGGPLTCDIPTFTCAAEATRTCSINSVSGACECACLCPSTTRVCASGRPPVCNPDGSLTCPEDTPRRRGSTEYCTLNDGLTIQLYRGFNAFIPIICGAGPGEPTRATACDTGGVTFRLNSGSSGVTISASDETGVSLTTTGTVGESGTITARVNTPGRSGVSGECFADYEITQAICRDIS
ncbi:hypothetical protein HY990_07450 [Candidatus Micrarchaeota archaeon]|nr:hypothetical protein [Candidatus Micrarchaeota archaeon]